MKTSLIPLHVGEIVSALPPRNLGMTPYMCSTSYTCRKAVPPGPPFGRRVQQICGLLAEKLISLKVLPSPLSFTFWITNMCTPSSRRFQFDYGKPSDSAYFSRVLDAPRQPAHADWAGRLSVLMLVSHVSKGKYDRTTLTTNCSAAADGCSVDFTGACTPASYGSAFNSGGGFYVMSNTQASGIQIWYWPRYSQSIPPEILWGNSLTPDSSWGTPAANFSMIPGYCNYSEYFNAQQIIFDLTFCVSSIDICLYCLIQRTTDILSFLPRVTSLA